MSYVRSMQTTALVYTMHAFSIFVQIEHHWLTTSRFYSKTRSIIVECILALGTDKLLWPSLKKVCPPLLCPNLDSVALILVTRKYCPPVSAHKVRYWSKQPQCSSCRPRNAVAKGVRTGGQNGHLPPLKLGLRTNIF